MEYLQKIHAAALTVNSFFSKQSRTVLVYFLSAVYAAACIEILKVGGVLHKFGINIFFTFALALVLHLIVDKKKTEINETQQVFYLFLEYFFCGALFTSVLIVLTLFSSGGVIVQQQMNVPLFFVLTLFTGCVIAVSRTPKKIPIFSPIQLVALLLLLTVFTSQLNQFFGLLVDRISRSNELGKLTSEERMEWLWGDDARFMKFAASVIPETATVMHPWQLNPWPATGNQFVVRRFLYPRKLIAPEWGKGEYGYLLVDDGGRSGEQFDGNPGWPTEIIPTKEVLLHKVFAFEAIVSRVNRNGVAMPFSVVSIDSQDGNTIESKSQLGRIWVSAEVSKPKQQSIWLSNEMEIVADESIQLTVAADTIGSVRAVVGFTDSNGVQRYILSSPNVSIEEETLLVDGVLGRIRAWEVATNTPPLAKYRIKVGLDVGYGKPMAYQMGRGVLVLDTVEEENFETCFQRDCITQAERLVFEKKWEKALLTLNRIEPLYPNDPYISYIKADCYEQIGEPEKATHAFEQAALFWGPIDNLNLPLQRLEPERDEK